LPAAAVASMQSAGLLSGAKARGCR